MPTSKSLLIGAFAAVVSVMGLLAYLSWNEVGIQQASQKLKTPEPRDYDVKGHLDFLTRGCNRSGQRKPFPPIFAELIHGNCRSLAGIHIPPTYFHSPDLRNLDLRSADLSSSYLVAANFSLADLTEADLHAANLTGSNLSFAILKQATLAKANLSSALLHNSNMDSVNLQDANLSGANIRGSNISAANLAGANLESATLEGTIALEADFRNANLQDSILYHVDLRKTKNLVEKQLQGDQPPFLCAAFLPENIQIDPNRDCGKLPSVLADRFPWHFATAEIAEESLKTKVKAFPGGMYPASQSKR